MSGGAMPGSNRLLELREVCKAYGASDDAASLSVLDHIDLTVDEEETVAVVGPSGSGKSTLLNIMGGLDRPTAGRVLLGGRDLPRLDRRELAAVRNGAIGFVFQDHHLLPQLSAIENVLVPTLVIRDSSRRRAAGERARALLEGVGLRERALHRPGQLSGGERQRVALARALINGPKLLLADEPTGSLDRAATDAMADLLTATNRREGIALVVVTHSPELARAMGRILTLRDGRLDDGDRDR